MSRPIDDELAAALAEATVTRPPAGLSADTVTRALSRRPAGRPVDAPTPCPPDEAFERTVEDLHELLGSLTDAEWSATAHPEHGRVRDLVAHLVGVERLVARWLDPTDDVPPFLDHVAATRPVVAELAGAEPGQLVTQWHAAARAVAASAAAGDRSRPITFHDLTVSIDALLMMHTAELWAHGMDIAAGTGRPLMKLDPERMAALAGSVMAAVPDALAYRRSPIQGRTVRFVLTGQAGGVYSVPLSPEASVDEPDALIVTDVVDLCLLAVRRLRPQVLVATIEGDEDLARLVVANLDAFARD
ncbi:MAG TPA: maleylpyruvate isomerase family mycothiol-dependent enzyme [Jiangellaceae bacterium]|nr:maleylpyruvate isomerase family mycothiol-dependent enzyme [Jiangellaceae bacterium]